MAAGVDTHVLPNVCEVYFVERKDMLSQLVLYERRAKSLHTLCSQGMVCLQAICPCVQVQGHGGEVHMT